MNSEESVSPTLKSKVALFKRLVKSTKVPHIKRVSSFAVIALMAVSSFYLAKRITQPVHDAQQSRAATSGRVESVAISSSNACSSASGVSSTCTLSSSTNVRPDPNNVCEANRGDKANCEKLGCQYYATTKACVVKGSSDICAATGIPQSCGDKTVGSSCTNPIDNSVGVCGHSAVNITAPDYCICKTSKNAIFIADKGTYCPSNSGGCMCNLQLIPSGAYCALHINADDYCEEGTGCLCTDIAGYTYTVASGGQCKSLPAGLQQWVDRTNALRQSCSTGTSSPTECSWLGLYQLADIVTLGQLSATNTAVQSYITCTTQLIAGTRTDCIAEAIAVGANATFVADAFIGVAKLALTAPQIVSNSIDSLSTILSRGLSQDVVTSQGVITKELFGAHYDELLKICGNCDNPVDLYTFLKRERLALGPGDGQAAWGSVQQPLGKVVDLSTYNNSLPVGGDGVIMFDLNYATDPGVKSMYDKLNIVPRQLDDMASTFINTTEKSRIQIVVHGSPDYVTYNGVNYYADDFANLLKSNGYNPDIVDSIDLISCNTAQSCSIIRPSFAENLANQLEVPVTAPTTQAQFNPTLPALAITVNPNGSLQFGVWTTFFPTN